MTQVRKGAGPDAGGVGAEAWRDDVIVEVSESMEFDSGIVAVGGFPVQRCHAPSRIVSATSFALRHGQLCGPAGLSQTAGRGASS